MNASHSSTLAIIPAFNEEASIDAVIRSVRETVPELDVLVISDGSADQTAAVARASGAVVLDLPCNLGVGGAVQAGMRYACDMGYRRVVRLDGDGQHDPACIPTLLAALDASDTDLVIGSRFLGEPSYRSTALRYMGIRCLAVLLSWICRKRVTDPTSGFQALQQPLLYFFSRQYPTDYPEPEALALMRRQGYSFVEVPAVFRQRTAGSSSIGRWGTLYYVFKVFLAILVDRARRIDPRYDRANLRDVFA